MSTPSNSLNLSSTTAGLVNWDGVATPSTTSLIQYYTMVGAGSNTVNNVAPGTSGQVLTSGGASSYPSYAAIPYTKMPWTDKAVNFLAASQNGYFVTASSIATLPASPAQGDVVAFAVDSVSGILTVTANTGQTISIGKNQSVSAGVAVSNFDGDSLTLVYRTSDTNWICLGAPQGTWSIT